MWNHFQYHTNFRDENGNEVSEDVESDVSSDVVMYHIRQMGKEGWIMHDFERVGTGKQFITLLFY